MDKKQYKYHVFAIDSIKAFIYVEGDNVYIAKSLIYICYYNSNKIIYIDSSDTLNNLTIPEDYILDGYDKNYYNKFVQEYNFEF